MRLEKRDDWTTVTNMNKSRILLCWSVFMLSIPVVYAGGQTSVTTCELQENAANYLNALI